MIQLKTIITYKLRELHDSSKNLCTAAKILMLIYITTQQKIYINIDHSKLEQAMLYIT